jgi:hypothetical protein
VALNGDKEFNAHSKPGPYVHIVFIPMADCQRAESLKAEILRKALSKYKNHLKE